MKREGGKPHKLMNVCGENYPLDPAQKSFHVKGNDEVINLTTLIAGQQQQGMR